MSWHKTLSAAHLKALDECYKKSADGYQVRWDGKVGIVTRSFQSAPNNNGDVIVPNPGGSTQLSWNTLGLPSFVGKFTGTPTSHNVRQYLSGTLAATATIEIVSVGVGGATGWSIVGDNLTHAGSAIGSGSFFLRAVFGSVSAESAVIPWSYIVQPPQTPVEYDWAPSDGLDNGTGAGNWVPFNGATLNANPTSDGYLQISYSDDWSGISSHHATPAFVAGFEYEVTVNIDAGGSRDRIWVQLGLGTPVVFSGTGAITHNVVCGSGTPNMVLHANGEAATGLNTRIVAISADPVEDVFSLTSAAHSVSVSAGTLQIGVTRAAASASSATVNIARTSGTNAVAQLAVSSLSWSANEGGTKFATLQLNGVGSVTLTISSPSVGSLGAVTSTVVTVSAAAAAADWPRLGMVWIGNDDTLGGHLNQYQSAAGIDKMRRRHTVVITRWPELQGATGVSTQSIAAAVKAASTIGTRIFNYCDQDAVYKDSATSAWATKRAKMAAMKWYLYANGDNGATVDSYFSNTLTTLNNTSFAPSDSNGMKTVEWILDHTQNFTVEGGDGNTPAPSMDGPYVDNIINSPRVVGDWNRVGGADSIPGGPFAPPWNVTPKTWYRQGIKLGVDKFRASHPGVPITGNLEFINVASKSDLPEYDQTFDGGSFEAIVGLPSSYESWMDTATLVQRIQNAEDMIRDPLLGIATGCPTNGSATNYREFRHFLAMVYVTSNLCLGWTRWTPWWSNWDWYDEYNVNFGQPTQTRRTAATQNGIWRRDFANVIVLWCPREVTGTISLGGSFRVLTGNAAAGRTPNSLVTSITFSQDRDGIVLARP